jgi:hypothetical protein
MLQKIGVSKAKLCESSIFWMIGKANPTKILGLNLWFKLNFLKH